MKTYRLVAVNEFCAAECLTDGLGLAFVAMRHVAACVTSYTCSPQCFMGWREGVNSSNHKGDKSYTIRPHVNRLANWISPFIQVGHHKTYMPGVH